MSKLSFNCYDTAMVKKGGVGADRLQCPQSIDTSTAVFDYIVIFL
ncbi:MAG: hypothetical protein ABSF91_06200 [Bacteroidota bacterium]